MPDQTDDLRWMWPSPFTWRLDTSRAWTVAEREELIAHGWGRMPISAWRYLQRKPAWRLAGVRFQPDSGIIARPWTIWLIVCIWHLSVMKIMALNYWALYQIWKAGHLHHEEGCIPRWRDVRPLKVKVSA